MLKWRRKRMTDFRPAVERDLAHMHNVFYQTEIQGVQNPPPLGDIPPELRHIFLTGTLYVAEQDGQILAFAVAIIRGSVTFLTDLFVVPKTQSAGLAKTLLQHVFPDNNSIRSTISSTDLRAHALYIRSGMQPQFPHYNLQWSGLSPKNLPASAIEIIEGDINDPAFIQWDARIGGRERPQDHEYWLDQQRGVTLWFQLRGKRVGYGYVRPGAGGVEHPEVCKVGPIGVDAPENATDCVLAVINWAQQRSNVVR